MYMMKKMIDMGLNDGQEWPSEAHKQVASTIGLCNKFVTTRDTLIEVCQAVIQVPADRINEVTYEQIVAEFGCPPVLSELVEQG